MILHRKPIMIKLLISLHKHLEELLGFLGVVFFGNVLLEPIHYQEKIVNIIVGLLTAAIIAILKAMFPTGITKIVNHLKDFRVKFYFKKNNKK